MNNEMNYIVTMVTTTIADLLISHENIYSLSRERCVIIITMRIRRVCLWYTNILYVDPELKYILIRAVDVF